jgi:hypothetical protein
MTMSKMFGGRMPNITQGQIAALLTFIVSQAVAFGWVDNETSQVLVSAGGTIVAAAWKIADALLRGKRAQTMASAGKL